MQTRKNAKYKCPACGLGTKTTTTRHIEDGVVLRRHLCDTCGTMYAILYTEDEQKVISQYKPGERYGYIKKYMKG